MLEDLRFAMRQLSRSRGFSVAVIFTLALAIGANTAVFSLLDGFLLRRLPYPHPEQLAVLENHQQLKSNPARFEDDDSSDGAAWRALQQNVPSVTAAISAEAFGDTEGINLESASASGGAARYVRGARVSAHYFQLLGVRLLLGRGFTEAEDQPGAGNAAVLSYNLWRTAFHSDPQILGRQILLKGAPHTIVGVLPADAQMPNPADIWMPLMPNEPNGVCGGNNCLILMRLKPGATWNQVRAQLAHMPPPNSADLSRENVWYFPSPLHFYAGSAMREQTEALMLAVAFILLIGCANLAGLMLARIHRRTAELATRLALGATPARLLRQLWIENLLLSLAGGAAGLALADLLLPVIGHLLPPEMIPIGGLSLNGSVLAFAFSAAVLTSILIGALPALAAGRIDLRTSLVVARTVTAGSGRLRQTLIGSEVALTLVLLAAAGLLVRTVIHLETLPPGFDPRHVITATASLDDARYRDAAHFDALLRTSLASMRRIPGVEGAAAALSVPYQRGLNLPLRVLDGPRAGFQWSSSMAWVTPGFFQTLRIPILSGRALRESDAATSQPVAVVNQDFGREFFGTPNPIGRHFTDHEQNYTIVGVVPDVVKQPGMEVRAPLATEPVYYVSAAQVSQQIVNIADQWFQPSWIVRAVGPAAPVESAMRRALSGADAALPVSGFYSMSDLLDQQLQTQRIQVLLLGILSGLALLLSAIGIYALVSNLVTQRTREIGIRIALGSSIGEAMRHVARSGLLATAAGIAAGLAGSFFALRALRSQIYGVGVFDPVTLAAVPLLLLGIALTASLLPALRIASIDPAETLRAE